MSDVKTLFFPETKGGSDVSVLSLLPLLMKSNGIDANTIALLTGGGMGGLGGGLNGLIGLVIVLALLNGGFGGFGGGLFGGGNRGCGCGVPGAGSVMLNNDANTAVILQQLQSAGYDVKSLAAALNVGQDAVIAAINGISKEICNMSYQNGQNTQNILMQLMQGNNGIMNQIANCCCDLKGILSKGFSDLGYQNRDLLCEIEKFIAASTNDIKEGQRAAEMREMQRDLNERDREIAKKDVIINNYQQTQQFAGMLQQVTAPLIAGMQKLQGDVDGILCKMPKTISLPYQEAQAIPNCVAWQYGLGLGLGPANGQFWG